MVLKKLFILNLALGGSDIYSLPSFSKLRMSEMKAEHIKDRLVEEGYLESYEVFTEKGIIYTARIRDFKNAKKYVHMLGFTLGILEKGTAIMVHKTAGEMDSHDFKRISIEDGGKQIYEILFKGKEGSEIKHSDEPVEISIDELLSRNISFEDGVRMITIDNDNEKPYKDELIFVQKGQLFLYDYSDNKLYERTQADIRMILDERMAV
jgi:hypothetical protein